MVVAAAIVLGLSAFWPESRAEGVPARMQAELLAVCRDAIHTRLRLELYPDVLALPSVTAVAPDRYAVLGSVVMHDRADRFRCLVDRDPAGADVVEVRVIAW